jgi:hypothetical protein
MILEIEKRSLVFLIFFDDYYKMRGKKRGNNQNIMLIFFILKQRKKNIKKIQNSFELKTKYLGNNFCEIMLSFIHYGL